ncbi:MAG TPA: dihydrofolate reductase, partial [Pyrinomonadaceae bacterium]|nr:dihydrofolate reductase [Pyrinomonadaceae bacterium]
MDNEKLKALSIFHYPFMSIIGIVAIAQNYAIGRGGKLPWHYSADLKFFKETTLNNAVVMGFNTWKSIGKPLPKRLNIVLSRSAEIEN